MANKLSDVMRDFKSTITKHSPEILMGLGIAGMVTSTILAVKATPKAIKLIDEAKEEKGEDYKKVDAVKAAWKCYIPSAAVAALSIGCLIGSSKVSLRRNTVLATAYKIAETAHHEYREQVIETIGEKKEKEIQTKVAEKKVRTNSVSNNVIYNTGQGNTLCYDAFSGRYFRCDINRIKRAEIDLREKINDEGYASLNDFYYEIGLDCTEIGDGMGWNSSWGKFRLDLTSILNEYDEPCLYIRYEIKPNYDYFKFLL